MEIAALWAKITLAVLIIAKVGVEGTAGAWLPLSLAAVVLFEATNPAKKA